MAATPPAKSVTTAESPPSLLHRLITLDTNLSRRLHFTAKPYLPHSLLLLLEYSADFRLFFPLALSLLLAPNPKSNPIHLLSPLILGLLLDLAFIGLVKYLVRRARPLYNPNNMSVAVAVDHFSFPSGHSSRVFFVAAVFYLSAADALAHLASASTLADRWIGADRVKASSLVVSAVWAWAGATSISRILLGRHFVLDVFAGACLGVLEGLVAFRFLRF